MPPITNVLDLLPCRLRDEVMEDASAALQAVGFDDLLAALKGIIAEPYGCSLCDSGKPRNKSKGHQPDCPFEMARAALVKAGGV